MHRVFLIYYNGVLFSELVKAESPEAAVQWAWDNKEEFLAPFRELGITVSPWNVRGVEIDYPSKSQES